MNEDNIWTRDLNKRWDPKPLVKANEWLHNFLAKVIAVILGAVLVTIFLAAFIGAMAWMFTLPPTTAIVIWLVLFSRRT